MKEKWGPDSPWESSDTVDRSVGFWQVLNAPWGLWWAVPSLRLLGHALSEACELQTSVVREPQLWVAGLRR